MNIQKNIPLANYTTFKTGGSAEFFCEIETKEDLAECFDWIKKEKLDFFCLGNGSNLLINDHGFHGAVLKIIDQESDWEDTKSISGSGIVLAGLITEARKRNLGGLEWAFGIPATLGGAVRNNAGAYGSEMANFVETVEVFDIKKAEFISIARKDCGFSYHLSVFKDKPLWLIWRVGLRWIEKDAEAINSEIQKYLTLRKEKQPLDKPSAGSFFRNPSVSNLEKNKRDQLVDLFVRRELSKSEGQDKEKLEKDIRAKVNQNETLPAAFLIEETGLKGREVGGAQVSNKHANFIINTSKAKTEDVIILASMVKQKVRSKFGVQLFEEVEYVGF